MKRTLNIALLLVVVFMTTVASAQKVKLKKDLIFIDKKEIPIKFESTKDGAYTFIDVSTGKAFLKADYIYKKVTEDISFKWLELWQGEKVNVNEADMEFFSLTLNIKKAVVEFIFKGLHFFDEKGVVDYTKVDEFFSEKRERVAEKEYQEELESLKEEREESLREIAEDIADQEEEIAEQYTDEIERYKKEQIKVGNIHNRIGYVIDSEGEKWEGKLSIAYKHVADPVIPQTMINAEIIGLTGRKGKTLGLVMYDEESGYSSKIFRAKNQEYCVLKSESGKDVIFQGLNIMKNPKEINTDFDINTQKVDEDWYCEELYERNGIRLFWKNPNSDLLIKTDDRELAFKFILSNKVLNRKILEKYLNKCTLGDKIDTVDFTSVEKVKELINFYNNSCN